MPPVGNTVDADTATWTNDIGSPMLAGYWQDLDYDASDESFYHVRVIEIPTPRWTTYDRLVFGTDVPEGIEYSHQERAHTLPIWHGPANHKPVQ